MKWKVKQNYFKTWAITIAQPLSVINTDDMNMYVYNVNIIFLNIVVDAIFI